MRSAGNLFDRIFASRAAFALFTLVAWVTAAFLFVVLKRVPFLHGASPITEPVFLVSLLPWLAASVFWAKLRKRVRLGKAEKGTASFCYSAIYISVCAAYVGMQLMGVLLLQVLSRVK